MSKGMRDCIDFVVSIEKLARVIGANRSVKGKGMFIRVGVQGVAKSHIDNREQRGVLGGDIQTYG